MPAWTVDDIPDQHGRTVLVTGANSGLGLRTAEALAARGARVLLGCRNAERAAAALAAVEEVCGTGGTAEVVAMDLADLSSVREAAAKIDASVDRLDVLVNNAGVMAIPKARTADGFEMQLGTNHLGHFVLTAELLGALHRSEAPRVVTVSSQAHRVGRIRWDDPNWERGRYLAWPAYGQSKLANLLFTAELARRAAAAGSPLLAASAHPGYSRTHLTAVGPQLSGNVLMQRVMPLVDRVFGQPDRTGALPQLYAATMRDVVANDYFGPDGPFESRGWPTRVSRAKAASDAAAAERLWALSERLTGAVYRWPAG